MHLPTPDQSISTMPHMPTNVLGAGWLSIVGATAMHCGWIQLNTVMPSSLMLICSCCCYVTRVASYSLSVTIMALYKAEWASHCMLQHARILLHVATDCLSLALHWATAPVGVVPAIVSAQAR